MQWIYKGMIVTSDPTFSVQLIIWSLVHSEQVYKCGIVRSNNRAWFRKYIMQGDLSLNDICIKSN